MQIYDIKIQNNYLQVFYDRKQVGRKYTMALGTFWTRQHFTNNFGLAHRLPRHARDISTNTSRNTNEKIWIKLKDMPTSCSFADLNKQQRKRCGLKILHKYV